MGCNGLGEASAVGQGNLGRKVATPCAFCCGCCLPSLPVFLNRYPRKNGSVSRGTLPSVGWYLRVPRWVPAGGGVGASPLLCARSKLCFTPLSRLAGNAVRLVRARAHSYLSSLRWVRFPILVSRGTVARVSARIFCWCLRLRVVTHRAGSFAPKSLGLMLGGLGPYPTCYAG